MPARARPTSPCTGIATSTTRARCCATAAPGARSSSATPCSPWTATPPTSTRWSSCARAARRAARARRGPRRARTRRRRSRPTPTCSASAPARRPSARSAVSSPVRARYIELVENSARPYIFTTAPTPADTAAALAALRVVRSTEGEALIAPAARRTSTASSRATRRRSCRSCCGEEQRAIDAAAVLLEHGVIVPAIRPPTVAPGTSRLRVAMTRRAHRRAGRSTPRGAGQVFGDARRRHDPRDRRRRRRRRHRHRDRQDVGDRGGWRPRSGAAASRSPPRKPVQSFASEHDAPDRCGRARRGDRRRRATPCVRRTAGFRPRWRRRWRPTRSAAADSPSRTSRPRSCTTPRMPTIVLVESAGGVRSPLADDGDTVDARARAATRARRARCRRRARHDQPRAAERRRARPASASSSISIGSTVTTSCTARNRDWLVTREGLEVVTDPEALEHVVTRSRSP